LGEGNPGLREDEILKRPILHRAAKARILPQVTSPISSPSEALFEVAVRELRAGKLVAFPTETVYGLGADATNEIAVRTIFEVKGRPSSNPLIVHLAEPADVTKYCDLHKSFDPKLVAERLGKVAALWPGPLSVVLPRGNNIAPSVCAGGASLAVRIPNHPVALRLLSLFAGPIAAPSANPSEYVSPTTVDHVRSGLGSKVHCILDGGPCSVGLESTVLSLLEPTPRILRPGAITAAELERILGTEILRVAPGAESSDGKLSPGLLAKHYAPRTPVRLLSSLTPDTLLPPRSGAILFQPREVPLEVAEIRILSARGQLDEVAVHLFAALRELDDKSLDAILVDTCEPVGLGEAIMDRLLRASSKTG
jgi:L-threonylcarbamoyladenylate synthase